MKIGQVTIALVGFISAILLGFATWVNSSLTTEGSKVYAQEGRISSLETDNTNRKEDIAEIKESQRKMQADIDSLKSNLNDVKIDTKSILLILQKYK